MRLKKTLARALALGALFTASAAPAAEFLGTLNMNLATGGDELITFVFTDGSETTIKGGSGVQFDIGNIVAFESNPFELHTSIGYKTHRTSASNGSASFSRWPIEVLGFYRNGHHRLGGGVAYHMNTKFNCDITGLCSGSLGVDDAVGFVGEWFYVFSGAENATMQTGVGLRYTKMEYGSSGGGSALDGSNIALTLRLLGPWLAK